MDPNFMASQVAENILLLQSQVDALKAWILKQPHALRPEQLEREMFDKESQIRNGPRFRELSDEFQRTIQSQEDAATLLQSLHDFSLRRMSVSE